MYLNTGKIQLEKVCHYALSRLATTARCAVGSPPLRVEEEQVDEGDVLAETRGL